MTGYAPVLWAVWGALVIFMLALRMYSGRLSRDEDDQLVLASSFDRVKAEQAAIIASVNRIEPLRKLSMALVAAMTLVVIAYYGMDILRQFR